MPLDHATHAIVAADWCIVNGSHQFFMSKWILTIGTRVISLLNNKAERQKFEFCNPIDYLARFYVFSSHYFVCRWSWPQFLSDVFLRVFEYFPQYREAPSGITLPFTVIELHGVNSVGCGAILSLRFVISGAIIFIKCIDGFPWDGSKTYSSAVYRWDSNYGGSATQAGHDKAGNSLIIRSLNYHLCSALRNRSEPELRMHELPTRILQRAKVSQSGAKKAEAETRRDELAECF